MSKFNKVFRVLLCVIDIYIKGGWVAPLKSKKVLRVKKWLECLTKKTAKNKPNRV